MADNSTPNDILDEFCQIVFDIYGTYCDICRGVLEIEKNLKKLPEDIKVETINFDDRNPIIAEYSYGRFIPASMKDEVKDRILPQFSYEDMLDRNKIGGINHRHIGNMLVVTIYQYWEDNYRSKLAKVMKLACKNCISANIFGDIAAIRRCIIHNGGKADVRIPKNSPEAWFEKGDDIFIDQFKFENFIIDEIYAFVKEFKLDPHKFVRALEGEK